MVLLVGKGDPVLTSAYLVKGSGEGSDTAKKVGGGAGLGALAGTAGGTAIAASKKGSNSRYPKNLYSNFGLRNR